MKKSEVQQLLQSPHNRDETRKLLIAHGLTNLFQDIEMDSQLADTHWDITEEAIPIYQHTHSFYEIIYCVEGTPNYLLNNRLYSVEPGDIILIPPNTLHSALFNTKGSLPYSRNVIWVSSRFLEILSEGKSEFLYLTEERILKTKNTQWEYIGSLFARANEEERIRSSEWHAMLVGLSSMILVLMNRAFKEQSNTSQKIPDLIESILAYIQLKLGKKITLTDTAKYFHISTSKLSHMFQKELGTSFYQCILSRRLFEAKHLISSTEMSMEEIANKVGFTEYSGFYRTFKIEYGISPLQYKQEVLNLHAKKDEA